MTCKLAFMWELAWNTPIKEADLWFTPYKEFNVDHCYGVPVSGIRANTKFLSEREKLEDVIAENSDLQVVWCHEEGETTLRDFVHPENALYIFGKTNYSPFLSFDSPGSVSVKIETPSPGLLWGHQAASVILYDRFVKWQ